MLTSYKILILILLTANCVWASDIQKSIEAAIATNTECKKLDDFYWEFGTASGKLYSGSKGNKYSVDTSVKIASASKWLFGAYVYEVMKGHVTSEQKEFLQMRSGYTNMHNLSCLRDKVKTVKDCFLAEAKVGRLFGRGSNAELSEKNKGKFYYNGGHGQALAIQPEINLSDKDKEALGKAISSKLNLTEITYNFPQLAGGGEATAKTYSQFLQNLMSDKYYLSKVLATDPGVCAHSACGAKEVAESPIPEGLKWWYANHYWIEKDDKGKTLAYSSPGLFGFYPWITADKKYYGLISRQGRARDRGETSILCGMALRDVFLKQHK